MKDHEVKNSGNVSGCVLLLILFLLILTAGVVFIIQEYRKQAALDEQKTYFLNEKKLNETEYEANYANLQLEKAEIEKKSLNTQLGLNSEINDIKNEFVTGIQTMQENQNNEINSLYDKYEKEARESVHENGFKAVFGVNPNYSDKKVIQDYIHMEFLLLLQRKCTLSTDIFDSSEESEIFKKELLRINTKLNFAKALTVYYKFKIPKEDAELAKNMKKWNKDTILECY